MFLVHCKACKNFLILKIIQWILANMKKHGGKKISAYFMVNFSPIKSVIIFPNRIYSLALAAIKYERRSRRRPSGSSRISTNSPKNSKGIDQSICFKYLNCCHSSWRVATNLHNSKEAITQRKHSSSPKERANHKPARNTPHTNKKHFEWTGFGMFAKLFFLECISNLSEKVPQDILVLRDNLFMF